MQQEDITIEIVGEVSGPPDFDGVVDKLTVAAEAKHPVILTPGECRVLLGRLTG